MGNVSLNLKFPQLEAQWNFVIFCSGKRLFRLFPSNVVCCSLLFDLPNECYLRLLLARKQGSEKKNARKRRK